MVYGESKAKRDIAGCPMLCLLSKAAPDREANVARGARADREGSYRVLGLAPGTSDVTVRAIGYRQERREAVRLVRPSTHVKTL